MFKYLFIYLSTIDCSGRGNVKNAKHPRVANADDDVSGVECLQMVECSVTTRVAAGNEILTPRLRGKGLCCFPVIGALQGTGGLWRVHDAAAPPRGEK